ncbi:acetyl-CoA carboxylase biotin carboxyl carrier protein subunit [Aequorivita antarctica]|uniref:Acetyl-CoA carboxylase biotin carboxyl carrier protein subunit n=1 Tax=Aequorivita antarctica TaxID=153266 RepID=A0A5C6YWF4_9FLAO|nr:acetyl-CoA carboxylase biotin carboxyl carrier protein subunit [Aequorivita antarctica]TXD71936.1 acetyl-CoA carboxylase biotin carboxyl carrier protein subunit [Aequorivita antarctica]SRX72965.1 Glutaconyl-CoA decarboxylase subunit gamma [Aequorivita antarctica]
MEEKFKAIVNDNFEFSLNSKDLEMLDVISDNKKANIIFNIKSVEVETLESDFQKKTYTLSINGNRYQVKIENQLDVLISKMGLSLGNASVEDEIHAPMPGLILEVNVSEGNEVKKGDFLCVLEAMKMENTLTAPRDGVVKSVNIVKGETVDKGKMLIEFQKND